MTPLSQIPTEQLEAELQARRDALPKVDPLLLEAREICARMEPNIASNVREGDWDNSYSVRIALAALRRGMELASAPADPVDFDVEAFKPLVREVINMYHTTRISGADVAGHILSKPSVLAAIRATLATLQAHITQAKKGDLDVT